MNILKTLFEKASEIEKTDSAKAKKLYENIAKEIERNKPLCEMNDDELRLFAECKRCLFYLSGLRSSDCAEEAIAAFDLYFKRGHDDDVDAYDGYVAILELSYHYEEAKELLMCLLEKADTKLMALKYLSQYQYCAEGLQSYDEMMSYLKQRIELTDDIEEKWRLSERLDFMKGQQ